MTNVLHVQKSSGIGGSERHLLTLLPALAARGVDVAMLVLRAGRGDVFTAALRAHGIPTVEIPAGPDVSPALVARLASTVLGRRPDLVHTHLIHADVHAQLAARLVGVPAVSTVHGAHGFYRRQPYKAAAAAAGRLARRTIAISRHVERMLVAGGIVPASRVRVVHYGIDVSVWAPEAAAGARPAVGDGGAACDLVVGIASRLIAGKGHDVLIRAAAQARCAGVELRVLVAGDGPERQRLEALVAQERIADAVFFLGFVADVASFMAACDVIAFPTLPWLGEGFGLAALEAMAVGRPVVASAVASLPEVVADGETGVLVEPGDPGSLAGALQTLASEPRRRQRMGVAGRERAAQCFSLDRMVDETLAVYAELLGGTVAPGAVSQP